MSITIDRRRREVVWRMDPGTALALAAFIERGLDGPSGPSEAEQADIDGLRTAAHRLEPPTPRTPT